MTESKNSKTLILGGAILVAGIVVALAIVFTQKEDEPAPVPVEPAAPELANLPTHTLIYGGDLITARRLNYALWQESNDERERLFSKEVVELLKGADIAQLNLEGMLTMGGYYNSLHYCTWRFRAHPRLAGVLSDIGVDLVTLGNNHNGDYGREALLEEFDHLNKAGIRYVGAGENWEDAERPSYWQVGDTVIAIFNPELTIADEYKATKDKPGIFFVERAFKKKRDDDAAIKYFTKRVKEARKHAHLVFFSPHWDAWIDPPAVSKDMRKFARRIIAEAGFDAIIAHGRHEMQGVELIGGKPVIYDAGNSMIDFNGSNDPEGSRGMLWEVTFNKAGVTQIQGIPIKMRKNRTRLASGRELEKAITRTVKFSEEFGTELTVKNDRIFLDAQPGNLLEPTVEAKVLKREVKEHPVRYAPTDVLHEKLPEGVKEINVQFEDGIRLIGYEMLSDKILKRPCSSMTVVMYWTADKPVENDYVIALEARRVRDGELENRDFREENHIHGDWMLPTSKWPVGKVIQDKYNMRLVNKKLDVDVAFLVGMRKLSPKEKRGGEGDWTKPVDAGGFKTVEDFIVLDQIPYTEEGITPPKAYEKWRQNRKDKIQLSPKQPPFDAPPLDWDKRIQ
ncbi:MAG: CapA family protein [Deltaproteobacteria bacterium]|nr:CapA family protein [Deltaproteobacteria bacterium]